MVGQMVGGMLGQVERGGWIGEIDDCLPLDRAHVFLI